MQPNKKEPQFDIGNVSGGINAKDPPNAILSNQVADAKNVILLSKGFKRFPGVENITEKNAIDAPLRGMHFYAETDGTEHLLAVYGGKLYEVNISTGGLTQLYDMTGTGEAWFNNYWGKCFVSNGAKLIKVEGSTAHSVGITPPAAGVSAAVSGGSLAAGVYSIYIAYARKIGASNVLYSEGFQLSNVTLSGGNLTVNITGFLNSTDPQVTNKVVFMTDAGGSVVYFYYQTNDNTTETINITDNSQKSVSILYSENGYKNGLPGLFEYSHVFGKRLYGSIGNKLYTSKKAQNSYDLEIFESVNYKEYPYPITGIFSLGENLYLNTDFGIIVQPNGDISVEMIHTEKNNNFLYMRTVAYWSSYAIGLTKRGVFLFSGDAGKFIDINLSKNITPLIQKMNTVDANKDHLPCGVINYRGTRTEYLLSYRNTDYGALNNNETLVLNLDTMLLQDNTNSFVAWETVTHAFNNACVNRSKTLYMGQSQTGNATIYKENSSHTQEKGVYNQAGTYQDALTDKTAYLKLKTLVPSLFGITTWEQIRLMLFITKAATLTVIIADSVNVSSVDDLTQAYNTFTWDVEWDVDWATDYPAVVSSPIDCANRGYAAFVVFEQTGNDPDMIINEMIIEGETEISRMT